MPALTRTSLWWMPLALSLPLACCPPLAQAAAVSYLQGGPSAAAATLTVEGAKAVADAFDAATLKSRGQYWTWDYAWTPCGDQTRSDANNTLAKAEAHSDCGPVGKADAKGSAGPGGLSPDATTRRVAVARSTAGNGDRYSTDGSSPWLTFLTRLVSIVIDPTPGPEVLDHNDLGWAGIQYDVDIIDQGGGVHPLLHLTADLVLSDATDAFQGYALNVSDSTGRLSASDFTPSLQNGMVTYTLKAPVDYLLRIDTSELTTANTPADFELTSQALVYAQSVPEPGALTLLLTGVLVAGLSVRRPTRQPKRREAQPIG